MTEHTSERILTACAERLNNGHVDDAILRLARDLADLRRETSPEEWRREVERVRRHPLHAVLTEDPYLWGAFHKPRGYAGDAHTLDFVYGRRTADSNVTPLGRALLAVSTNVPIARAVRARCDYVTQAINDLAERDPTGVVLSIACGHMRELHKISAAAARLQFVGIDQDRVTIEQLPTIHPDLRLDAIEARISGIIAGKVALPRADLIYASGLFDYLENRVAVALTSLLMGRLRPGGVLLIPNLTPCNEEIACMEAVWDWWMIYRGEKDMEVLAAAAAEESALTTTIHSIADGRVACLVAHRAAAVDEFATDLSAQRHDPAGRFGVSHPISLA